MLLAIARRIGSAARSRSRVSQQQNPSQLATSQPILEQRIATTTIQIKNLKIHRQKSSGKPTGRQYRISCTGNYHQFKIDDRVFWKLPITPTTGRARSASPMGSPGTTPTPAPGESPPAAAPQATGCVPGTGWERGRALEGSKGYRCLLGLRL
jgi:hypothetical protein